MSTDTATTTPAIATGTYMIDPSHSEVGFVARHAMITKVRGAFRTFEGTGYFDQKNPSNSHLKLDILADSIDTGNADRDGHLRGNDFFDMENHPGSRLRPPASRRPDTTPTGSPATSA